MIAKPSYPPGAFRVPGGALRRDEPMDVGALREAHEETGLNAASALPPARLRPL